MTKSSHDSVHMAPPVAAAPSSGTQCPVCGSGEQTKGAVYNSYQLNVCPACTLTYTAIREMPADLYQDEYENDGAYLSMLAAAQRTASGEWGFRQLWWYKRVGLRWLEDAGSGRRIVDIGCGPGTFLMVAKSRGWEVAGVDPAAPAAERAREMGLDVTHGFVEPFAAAVLQPHADFGLDRVVAGKPQRLDLLQSVRLACRDDQHFARRFRLVRPLQRELKPDMLNAGLSRPAHLLAAF